MFHIVILSTYKLIREYFRYISKRGKFKKKLNLLIIVSLKTLITWQRKQSFYVIIKNHVSLNNNYKLNK